MPHRSAPSACGAAFLVAALSVPGAAVAAQTVYRCAPNVYTQQPCAGGRGIDVADPRSAEQTSQAQKSNAAVMQRAQRMQRERLAYERSLRPPAAGSIGPAPAAEEELPRPKKNKKSLAGSTQSGQSLLDKGRPKTFVAYAPGSRREKKKAAARQADQD